MDINGARITLFLTLLLAFSASSCAFRQAGSRAASPSQGGSVENQRGRGTETSKQLSSSVSLIKLPGVGRVSWTCRGAANNERQFSSTFKVSRTGATTSVEHSVNGSPPKRKRLLQPGQKLSTPYSSDFSHVWRVKQSTEPSTIRSSIQISFGTTPSGTCRVSSFGSLTSSFHHE